jgi:hypothetical protein
MSSNQQAIDTVQVLTVSDTHVFQPRMYGRPEAEKKHQIIPTSVPSERRRQGSEAAHLSAIPLKCGFKNQMISHNVRHNA